MYKVKLIKGISYTGVVRATKDNPCVDIEDEKTAKALVATGYFALIETADGNNDGGNENGKSVDEMTIAELKQYSADKGINLARADKKTEILAKIKEAETADGNNDGEDGSADYGEDN